MGVAGEKFVVAPGADGRFTCPECKEQFGDKAISFPLATSLGAHRKIRHGVQGSSATSQGYKPSKKFEQTDRGTFICPECLRDDFTLALLVGRHRFYEHGIKVNPPKAERLAAGKPGRPRKEPLALPEVQAAKEVDAPEFVVAYLFGRVEIQIESYAKDNGLAAGSLKNYIGDLLKQSA